MSLYIVHLGQCRFHVDSLAFLFSLEQVFVVDQSTFGWSLCCLLSFFCFGQCRLSIFLSLCFFFVATLPRVSLLLARHICMHTNYTSRLGLFYIFLHQTLIKFLEWTMRIFYQCQVIQVFDLKRISCWLVSFLMYSKILHLLHTLRIGGHYGSCYDVQLKVKNLKLCFSTTVILNPEHELRCLWVEIKELKEKLKRNEAKERNVKY